MDNEIHPTALVSPNAVLGTGNTVGPFVVIEAGVALGNDNSVAGHSVLKSGTTLGDRNVLAEHAVLGGAPQDLGFDITMSTRLLIGDDNTFREYVTVHRASKCDAATQIGKHNFFMNGAHIAHDCEFGDRIIVAPFAAFGGHVRVDNFAFISGGVMVHQFSKIGRNAMIGGNSKITQDVLPYMITDGVPGKVRGLNSVGLRRAGFSPAEMRSLKAAFQLMFGSVRSKEDLITELNGMESDHCRHLADFVSTSRRGFHRV